VEGKEDQGQEAHAKGEGKAEPTKQRHLAPFCCRLWSVVYGLSSVVHCLVRRDVEVKICGIISA